MFKIYRIGTIYTNYENRKETPKQGKIDDQILSCFVLKDEFLNGASNLNIGDKLILVFRFDKHKKFELLQVPYGKTKKYGVFSTRSPRRPNFLGMTQVEIIKIENNKFYFYGADMLNGTPLIDIKPVLNSNE